VPYIDKEKLKFYIRDIGQIFSNIIGDELAFTDYKRMLSREDQYFLKKAEAEGKKLAGKIDIKSMERVLVALDEDKDNKDISTYSHCKRVACYTVKLCEGLGIDQEEIPNYRDAADLHDIGMIGTPQIYESRRLNEDELRQMQRHTTIGRFILKRNGDNYLSNGAGFHHERWDGDGYPSGKAGEDVPFVASLISVADAYDSMTFGRPWKDKMDPDQALEEIAKEAGKQFHPDIAKLKILEHLAA
jgi:HD-GYP domain-containing protein (c-di-GMP phosphodiesterase class II)